MKNRISPGFTIVEVVVTLVVSSLLAMTLIRIQTDVSKLSILQVQRSTASERAYNNLRRYVNDKAPTWFICSKATASAPPSPMVLIDDTNITVEGLPSPVSQKVVATAPYNCGGGVSTIGTPIRVESTVTYGPENRSVTHVSYAAY